MQHPTVIACMLTEHDLARLREKCTVHVRPMGCPVVDGHIDTVVAVVTTPYDQITPEFLRRAQNLKLVAQFGAGTDNIDLEAAKAHGVIVTHTPGITAISTAELTMALILSLTRRLPEARHVLGERPDVMPLGMGLTGKKLGIVGLGRIGSAVARRAHAFGMKIFYHNRKQANPTIERETIATRCSLEELFTISDVVTLHCDLNPDSHKLVDAKVLSLMKSTAILINTARAGVVDEAALIRAIASGHIGGAGLDVFGPIVLDALRNHPRVVLTPHAGTATTETRAAMSNSVVESILSFLDEDATVTNRKI
ncbi:MAG: D-glycerate dehydrogenase [Bacteroidota bacterium]|nr:D-glycerate dehydrogenase [Bacteroidota bacterium]